MLSKQKQQKQQQSSWQPHQINPSTERPPWERQSSSFTWELCKWMPSSYRALCGTHKCVMGYRGPPGPDDYRLMITASEPNILWPDESLEFPHSQTVPTGRASCVHGPSSLVTIGTKSCQEAGNSTRGIYYTTVKMNLAKIPWYRKPC